MADNEQNNNTQATSNYFTLSKQEQDVVNEILKQAVNNNDTSAIDELYYKDYDEIPVSFNQFVRDNYYLGKSTRQGTFIYPFWIKEANKIFQRDDIEIALSGCLAGDTRIPLIDGTTPTIKELADSGRTRFELYSYDLDTNEFTVGTGVKAFSTGYKMTYSVTFDNGKSIRITGNHKFLTRDKHYKSIDEGLTVGDSIMPFNRTVDEKGYEIIEHPQKNGGFKEEPTHRMVMRYKKGSFKGTVHHKDYNKRNNSSNNLIVMDWSTHHHFHAIRGGQQFKNFNEKMKNGEVDEETLQKINDGRKKGTENRWKDPQQHIDASIRLSKRNKENNPAIAFWNSDEGNKEKIKRRKLRIKYNKQLHPNVVALKSHSKDEVISTLKESVTFAQCAKKLNISRSGLTSLCNQYNINADEYLIDTPLNLPNRYWSSRLNMYNTLLDKYGVLNDDIVRASHIKGLPLVSTVVENYYDGNYSEFEETVKNYNHKIVSIKLNEIEEVYDIEVEKYHNFALDSGIVVHNSIGIGKTTIACIMMCYHLYKTMCLHDPQAFFNLSPGSTIAYAFLNNTLTSSYGVGYETMQSFLKESPWFLEHGYLIGRGEQTYQPGKGFGLIVGSRPQHTLGRHVICALMDEVSFAPGQDPDYSHSHIMELYSNIRRRMDSRFMVEGKNYGKMFLVSSKATEDSFLEAYIADQVKKGYPIYVVDQPLWKVKPGAYSGKTFKIAVGNKYIPSKILEGTDEEIEKSAKSYEEQGLSILDVPIEHRQAFDQNIDKALQDIAGISTSTVSKVFNMDKIQMCFSETLSNPFRSEVISLGIYDSLQLKDFFDSSLIPNDIYGCPVFIHIDASISGDRTGISAIAIKGSRQVTQYGANVNEQTTNDELICQQIFSVGIQPPSDSEVSFQKTRDFIYYLRDDLGLNIKMVSTDGFQSVDTRQILASQGFDVNYTSLDRTPEGYDGLKSAILDRRIILLPNCHALYDELTDLECNNITRKYDHPVDGCFTIDTKILIIENDIIKKISIEQLLNEYEIKNYKVLTINEENNKCELKSIKRVFYTKQVNKLLKITLSNNEIIQCTLNHKFMLDNNEFIEAQYLTDKIKLKTVNDIDISIKEIEIINVDNISVYDLEIEDNHNFALASGVFVHNSKDIADSLAGALLDAQHYKNEYLFFHPTEFDYEGFNDGMDLDEQYISNFSSDILSPISASNVNHNSVNQVVNNQIMSESENAIPQMRDNDIVETTQGYESKKDKKDNDEEKGRIDKLNKSKKGTQEDFDKLSPDDVWGLINDDGILYL